METTTEQTPTLSLVEIEQEAIMLRQQSLAIAITDQESYDAAVVLHSQIRTWLKNAEDWFKGMKDPAYAAWRKICDNEKKACDPVRQTMDSLKAAFLKWDREQEDLRLAEQKRLREAAEAEEETRRQALLSAQSAASADGGAFESEIAAILEAPVQSLPAPRAAPTYQRSGLVVYRDNWQGEVTDLMALVRHIAKAKNKSLISLLQINQSALNAQAKALKEQMDIPGVRAVNNKSVAGGRSSS